LEEVRSADLLLHLVDMTNPLFEEQVQVIEEVLNEIGALRSPGDLGAEQDRRALCGAKSLRIGEWQESVRFCAETNRHRRVAGNDRRAFWSRERADSCLLQRVPGRIIVVVGNAAGSSKRVMTATKFVTAIVTPKLAGQMRKLLRYDRGRGQAPRRIKMLNLPNFLT
jgi:hypothetical protein